MRTVRISIGKAKGKGATTATNFSAALAVADSPADPFIPVKGAVSSIAASLAPATPIDDPDQPGQPLTATRVQQLHDAGQHLPVVGRFLYALLARGKLRSEWERLRQQGDLRTQIEFADERALAPLQALPWERLLDDDDNFLALQPGSPLVRTSAGAGSAPALDWPIRVLVAQCAEREEPSGGAPRAVQIAADAELLALERLFASPALRFDVEYDVLENPTPAMIVEACRDVRPHVLHFIGHGRGGALPQQHALSLWLPATAATAGRYVDWFVADIRTQLKDIAPRLAFLNACRSSGAASTPAPVASVSHAFLRAGSVAALGMQGDIAGDLAKGFATAFYRELMAGADIDTAAQIARGAMSRQRADASVMDDVDWALPVLTLRALPHEVLPHPPALRDMSLAERFVARLPQRRATHGVVRCCAAKDTDISQHMVVIVGRDQSGKSHLARWSAQSCKRVGARVVSVDFDRSDKVDWLDALRWIRDAQRPQRGGAALPAAPQALPPTLFRDFNWRLNRRQQGLSNHGMLADAAVAPDIVLDAGAPLTLTGGPALPEKFSDETLADFQAALVACAGEQGLVLTLNKLDGLESTALKTVLMRGLFRPIAAGALPGVRLMMVLSDAQYDDCRTELESGKPFPHVVHVPYFDSGADFRRVARQLSHLWSDQLYDIPEVRSAVERIPQSRAEGGPWGSVIFSPLNGLFRAFAALYP